MRVFNMKHALPDAFLDHPSEMRFVGITARFYLLAQIGREKLPLVKEDRRVRQLSRDHLKMTPDELFQLFLNGNVSGNSPRALLKLVGGAVDNLPEHFLFRVDMRVETGPAQIQRLRQRAHGRPMIPMLAEQVACRIKNIRLSVHRSLQTHSLLTGVRFSCLEYSLLKREKSMA